MTGVTLYGLDVALVQLELVGDTGVPKAVEDDRRQIVFFDQVLQCFTDLCRFARQPNRRCDHQIKIGVFVADGFNRCILLHLPGNEHLCHRFRKENFTDTRGSLGRFQHKCSPVVNALIREDRNDVLGVQCLHRLFTHTLQFLGNGDGCLSGLDALIGYIHTVPCQGQKLADAKRTGEGKVEAKLQPGILA